jgi:hypothetical protein
VCGHRAATEVDHTPRARIILDEFGADEFFAESRLTSLCHGCHSVKTKHELGFVRGGTNLKPDQLGDRLNLTIICGQAGCGKSTYVEQHKAAHDQTWDYDVIMSDITGLPIHQGLPGAIGSVLAARDAWVEATRYYPAHCWLIVTNPKAEIVKMLSEAGAEVIVMDTPDDVCAARLRQRFIDETLAQAPSHT